MRALVRQVCCTSRSRANLQEGFVKTVKRRFEKTLEVREQE
jgi:hypothetical protein